jgi:aryl-alcohol dehydrogenase-like predicted oxidoreductase
LRNYRQKILGILPRFQGDNFVENQKLTQGLKNIAEEKKCSMAQLALAWILTQNKNIVPIPGTKRTSYLEDNLGALDLRLSQEERNKLENLFPMGIAKGQKYPEAFENEA